MRRTLLALAMVTSAGCQCHPPSSADAGCADWTQWAHDSMHSGQTCVAGQSPDHALATFVFDPFTQREQWEDLSGDLVNHYPTPLIVGDDVYMLLKSGTYVDCEPTASGPDADGGYTGTLLDGGRCGPDTREQEIWNEAYLHWENGALVQKWVFASDWKPVTDQLTAASWEPVFQAAVYGNWLYVPGAGGGVHRVDRHSGMENALLNGGNAFTFLTGGITVDPQGDLFFNTVSFDSASPFNDVIGTLVKVTPAGGVTKASYRSLVKGAPAPSDPCFGVFDSSQWSLPDPPLDGGAWATPGQVSCLSQRPGVNVTPAIGPDGTIYTVSRAHLDSRYSYAVAVNPDLTPKWTVSLRDVLDDGCGVLVPADADGDGGLPDGGFDLFHCRAGAPPGVDPLTNQKPAGRVDDTSSSSPVALPDGTFLYGALTTYNTERGHLFHLGPTGVLATYDFGWDDTPAWVAHDGTYSILTKDNHYFFWDGSAPTHYLTRLNAQLQPEWRYLNSDVQPGHPNGFEWCINAPALDADEKLYGNAEDGRLYVINPDGSLLSSTFLTLSLGAAYTPLAIDSQGRIYALNGGVMTVLGQ